MLNLKNINLSQLQTIKPVERKVRESAVVPVVQYTLEGQPIAIHESAKEAARAIGKPNWGNIYTAAKPHHLRPRTKKQATAYGFQWRLLKDVMAGQEVQQNNPQTQTEKVMSHYGF